MSDWKQRTKTRPNWMGELEIIKIIQDVDFISFLTTKTTQTERSPIFCYYWLRDVVLLGHFLKISQTIKNFFNTFFSRENPTKITIYARYFHSYNKRHRDLLRPPLARTTKYEGSFAFSGTKNWNTLPLALRSEHDLNTFRFGLNRHFRSKPNWASNTFAILSCSTFYLLLSFVLLFLFTRVPFKPALLNSAHLTKYCLNK